MEKDEKESVERLRRQIGIFAKLGQGFFIALFLLGFSTGISDLVPLTGIPLSPFSVASMTYGGIGMVACEYISRKLSK